MGLQFILSGLLFLSVVIIAFLTPTFRNMETVLPDHDQMKRVQEVAVGKTDEIQPDDAEMPQAIA